MTNPAYELAAIFEGWKYGGGVSLRVARGNFAKQRGMSESEVIASGMAAIVEIRQRLEAISAMGVDTGGFRASLPSWQQDFTNAAVSNPRDAEATGAAKYPTSIERLNSIKGLGAFLDLQAVSYRPRPEYIAKIDAAIADAEAFVKDADLQDEFRHYLLALLARIRTALKNGHLSEYRAAVHEFVGATVSAENMAPAESKPGWRNIRETVLIPVLDGTAANLLSAGIVSVAGLIG